VSHDLDQLAVNTIRTLTMDAVEAAKSGHPGTPMALAPLGYVLFTRHLVHDPTRPDWADRDRFILSAGHASMLQYALAHLTGYDVPLEEIRRFRQLGSRTPGHPEYRMTPGVETTTGPLGQGLGNGVGMALAERMLAARFNRTGHEVINHRTWVIASDGDIMEGISAEASSLAGHLGLDNLVVCWDDNGITIDGSTALAFTGEDVLARYAAYGWRTLEVADANDLEEIDSVLKRAAVSDGRPTLVRVPTTIAYGAPTKAGTASAHGAPLGPGEVEGAKAYYGWADDEPFTVPASVREHADQTERGQALRADWERRWDAYEAAHPELAAELRRRLEGRLHPEWREALPAPEGPTATRKASGKVLNALADVIPELVGGSADLSASNAVLFDHHGAVTRDDARGRTIYFGVREHAKGAILNGMRLHGGFRPFGGTFLIFSDYMRPAMRLAAMMSLPVVYVFTHDSIGLGEDGPTHQPSEQLAGLRSVPNLHVLRPADARETVGAWRCALERTDGPTALVLTRQTVPDVDHTDADEVARGGYVIRPANEPDVVLVATGSELAIADEAANLLEADDIDVRLVSLPSWELLDQQPRADREELLPDDVPTVSVEAGIRFGWERWADAHVGMTGYGASAPWEDLYEHFGITPEAVADQARRLLAQQRR